MAKISDIKALRPELLDKSQAELERQMAELQMAIAWKAEEGARKEREAKIAEAGVKIDAVLDGLRWLNDNGFLGEKVVAAFTNAKGVFTPHLSFRKPNA